MRARVRNYGNPYAPHRGGNRLHMAKAHIQNYGNPHDLPKPEKKLTMPSNSSPLTNIISGIKNVVTTVTTGTSSVGSDISKVGGAISGDLGKIGGTIGGDLGKIGGFFGGIFNWLKEFWWIIIAVIVGIIALFLFVFAKGGGSLVGV